jgi:hypothetical protein
MSEKKKNDLAIKPSKRGKEKIVQNKSSVDFELSDDELGDVSGASGAVICNAKPQQQK